MNLSYNKFLGVPKENQFLTFDDPSSYVGNPYLCKAPLQNECPIGVKAPTSSGNENNYEKVLSHLVIAFGFATGFWGVIGTLLFKKSWRHSYFQFVENTADRMYVAIVVRAAKLRRWMKRNHIDE